MGLFKRPDDVAGDAYSKHRERAGRRSKAASKSGRDIGAIPPIADAARRDDFGRFCKTYFPNQFGLPWSADHPRVLAKLQEVADEGGTFAVAMPRGSGKTSMAEALGCFAALYGLRKFLYLIAADEGKAIDLLDSIKVELETNDLLLADFPEVCFPIRELEGIAQRSKGQLCNGARTGVRWETDTIVFPAIAGSRSASCIIRTRGLLGGIRGAKFKRPDGESIRPDLAIVDDPQTDESARSPSQTASRLNVVLGAILGLAGPGKKIAAIMPCTVIRPNDLADQVLDRKAHPEWQGERTKLVYRLPAAVERWDEYAEIRREGLRGDAGVAACNEFYLAHRAEMDADAEVAWAERFNPDEYSAVQNAQNIRIDRGDDVFYAEYQNEPRVAETKEHPLLKADEVAARINRRPRLEVPTGCEHLTAFVDVQQQVLFWLVAAWGPGFTGYIVDYGATPRQRLRWFDLQTLSDTLETLAPTAGLEGQIYAGLEAFGDEVLAREWKREDGASLRINRCHVDANWGASSDTVYKWCRESKQAALVMPSHGRGVGPDSVPISRYKPKANERIGLEWSIAASSRGVRYCTDDTNFWKSFVESRLRTAIGDRGALTLFGSAEAEHRLLAAHCTAEFRTRTEGRGRTVDVWRIRPERPDNHWWDCLVGAHVAASTLGVNLGVGGEPPPPKKRRRGNVSYLT